MSNQHKLLSSLRHCVLTAIAFALCSSLSSCLNDDDEKEDLGDWDQRNAQYVTDAENSGLYTRLAPPWAPESFSLVKWHNDRALTKDNLSPLDNSIVDVKYHVTDIDGNLIDSSYNSTLNGDSIYRSRPSANITGFWYVLTQMHVGDSVTTILPAISGYGSVKYGNIQPNTTLIYYIKMVDIPAYVLPV